MTNEVLKPVHPNAGIEAAYRKKLKRLISEMNESIFYWLTARYKAEMAHDESSVDELQGQLNKLTTQWQTNFDDSARKLAEWFGQKTKNYADGSLDRVLKEAGMTVEFKMTEGMNNTFSAVVEENVGLIKSIAQEHLSEVQGLVMRSVQNGRNLGYLHDELRKRYGITKRRAELISRDQNNKATASLTRTRQIDLGIKQAMWKHSTAGKHPRPGHVQAGKDKLVYDLDKGAYIDGEWIFPGELINCRCVAIPIIPGLRGN